ncbi:MAG: Rieske 2Fe-2S domain-containing protein [Candidatus Obscuribacterales bacterium]|nr:Rieske 2Fe-2S domain-containing protein [Candidatus Obscuribacterales bacterium]
MSRPDLQKVNVWEDDFPIEKGKESYVTRRQFSNFLVLTSLGMFIGNLWILAQSIFFKARTVFPKKVIGRASEIKTGGVKIFRYPEEKDPCILIRTPKDRFVAYSQKCTHLACPVQYSPTSNKLECPCHDGHFSVETGEVLQGPPPRRLPRVIIERDGDLLVAVALKLGEDDE